ncbi:hypothetical protein CAPTEDRAFT_206875 [Capitella teleta]|uniref:Uncharacterized protein n=1 Tax=Capitella teleta TaxID=283909 RepID=R7UGA0_CAPTE|nr:hypothetical protein CAPTEDRAFT_206875 [Capitella teleta]|eukprot:ELU05245.1 hypothetical protein CAPTEDRAFT_206875 [Capitella teleta]
MPPQTESRHGHGEDISHRKRPCSSPPMRVPLFVPANVGKPSLRSTLKIRRKNGREMVPLYIWTIGNSNRHANNGSIVSYAVAAHVTFTFRLFVKSVCHNGALSKRSLILLGAAGPDAKSR